MGQLQTKFSITLDSKEEAHEVFGVPCLTGKILIDDFKEEFDVPVAYWSAEKYIKQWQEASKRVLDHKESALVTYLLDPRESTHMTWWLLYPVKDLIYVRNHLLIYDSLTKDFDENNLYEFIPEREESSETGMPISEWKTTRDALMNQENR